MLGKQLWLNIMFLIPFLVIGFRISRSLSVLLAKSSCWLSWLVCLRGFIQIAVQRRIPKHSRRSLLSPEDSGSSVLSLGFSLSDGDLVHDYPLVSAS